MNGKMGSGRAVRSKGKEIFKSLIKDRKWERRNIKREGVKGRMASQRQRQKKERTRGSK